MSKIIVGLSGGVDSSVVCKLLLEQGFEVEALFMKNWEEDDTEHVCTAEQDLKDAKQVAKNLGIKLHTVNFAYEYWHDVFEYFLQEYKKGRTPNPDVICNKEIKFKQFLNLAKDLGASKIATGHYAKIYFNGKNHQLLRGHDSNKDQSYFLYLLNQYQLSQSLFPLGDLTKPEIRQIAKQQGFANANKKDSTGICFIGERNFKNFLTKYLPAQKGAIKTADGDVIGEHSGLMYYTIGQRKGLKIGGLKYYDEKPWYVLKKDLQNNILIAGQNPKHKLLASNIVEIETPHWMAEKPQLDICLFAQTRYRQNAEECEVIKLNKNTAFVKFRNQQYAITAGQSLVVYSADLCLGGGIISNYYKI